jgi:hypothetical protein
MRSLRRTLYIAMATLLPAALSATAPTARAAIAFLETFDTNTSDAATTYGPPHDPAFVAVTSGTAPGAAYTVSSQQLHLTDNGTGFTGNESFHTFYSGLNYHFTVDGDLGGNLPASPGDYNVGMRIDNLAFVFHPGYTGNTFQVIDAVAHTQYRLINPGFTPDASMAHMRIDVQPSTETFTVSFTQGVNSYTYNYSPNTPAEDALFDPTNPIEIGFFRLGKGGNTGVYDNLQLTIPEPTGVAIGAIGTSVVIAARGRSRRQFH